MLSYQHAYHAGNLADVHKHAALAWCLAYMAKKNKPISYLETHGGRGLYDLGNPQAKKTGEAEKGIGRALSALPKEHPYVRAVRACRQRYGASAYPGSPLLAATLLRSEDKLQIAEMHPGEHALLSQHMRPFDAACYHRDGFDLALSICPPSPRRGILLIDPSYEIKTDYSKIPHFIAKLTRTWNVGVVMLWYPIVKDNRHQSMVDALAAAHSGALSHEVRFRPAKDSHGMIGSGLFVQNAPFGLPEETNRLTQMFDRLD
ncbi:MAG: 23S rRNA (adenine(2030)-N(6))-methyltransferase RlmJ [Pseudomonadota bacterium]